MISQGLHEQGHEQQPTTLTESHRQTSTGKNQMIKTIPVADGILLDFVI